MIEGKPSATAELVALRRGVHQLIDRPLILDDPIAVRIIGTGNVQRAAYHLDDSALRRAVGTYLRAYMVARSRFAEDELREARHRGVTQYVILGAGLETYAYRQTQDDSGLQIFEVDHPATQSWKLTRLAEAGIEIPDNVIHVPVDFASQSLETSLSDAGVRPDRPVFFSWLGVTMYLERDAIVATLRYIVRAARGGGGVVFDFVADWTDATPAERVVLEGMVNRVKNAGEPWLSVFKSDELTNVLRTIGFSEVTHITGEELNRRYFSGRTDGLQVARRSNLMRALA